MDGFLLTATVLTGVLILLVIAFALWGKELGAKNALATV